MNRFNYRPSYRRNLPHIQPPGASFFMTFRLAGSLPISVVKQWNLERQWLRHLAETNPKHLDKVKQNFDRRWFAKFEVLLDQASTGPTWLKGARIASMVADSLHHRDGWVYRLDAFTIMSNHVHTVFKPLPKPVINSLSLKDVEYYSLASIMHSLKGYTAFQANRILGRQGEFWRMRATITGFVITPNGNELSRTCSIIRSKQATAANGEIGSGVMFVGNEVRDYGAY